MKKKFISFGIACGTLMGAMIIAYAASSLFFTQTVSSNFQTETIFQFDLSAGLTDGAQVAPGGSFSVEPTIYSDATEDMYVFIKVDQPICGEDGIYTYDISEGWLLVSSETNNATNTTVSVYAYAGNEMTTLCPGETTAELTSQMTMRNITNAQYSQLESINITITGYGIGTDSTSVDPSEAWSECMVILESQ